MILPSHLRTGLGAAGVALLLTFLMLGCGAVRDPALESARDLYVKARQDPMIVARAGAALDRAGQTIDAADRRWNDDKDVEEVEHLSYIATKQIEIARVTAQRRLAEDEIRQLRNPRPDANRNAVQ